MGEKTGVEESAGEPRHALSGRGLWAEARRWSLAYAPSYSLGSLHEELTAGAVPLLTHSIARVNKHT